ncbi:hypothetical protein BGZ61DRAFT_467254 [Ilyonectria robusta]|uniref:uncharacterized protein n=1 Tax=Ilyonectria robusta TaxID=1079257 RepID=UPI001E8E0F6C|nr:uncharacterized protein BGZ61DRAFT_467254 [Ilyonectria robusta]KAH8654879.1 hypothetical protein BGZ61DRAFT_467254 [Ilyonectria robusta]
MPDNLTLRKATIYPSRGYSGPSLRIYDEECVRLRPPLRSRVGSIKITEDTYCEFYTYVTLFDNHPPRLQAE